MSDPQRLMDQIRPNLEEHFDGFVVIGISEGYDIKWFSSRRIDALSLSNYLAKFLTSDMQATEIANAIADEDDAI